MANKYIEELKKEIISYYYTFPDIDYVSILMSCTKKLENIDNENLDLEELTTTKNKILSIILDIPLYLTNKDFKYYIKLINKLKIYKYKDNIIFKLLLKYCPRLGIIYHFSRYRLKMFSKYQAYNFKFNYTKKIMPYPKKNLHSKKLYIPYIELVITTKCTLRCKNCANLISHYEKPYDVDTDIILKSVKKITKCCTEIARFRILGGEPFCNPNLKDIIKILPKKKIRDIVIVTNGTLIPNDKELIKVMQDKHVRIEISDYANYSYKKYELLNFLVENDIEYSIYHTNNWYDYGEFKNYHRGESEIKEQFLSCDIPCRSILNGCLYYCPRAAHGYDLGLIGRNEDEYIDLLKNSNRKNKQEVKKLIKRQNSIEACKYCLYGTKDCKLIKVAEQLPKK